MDSKENKISLETKPFILSFVINYFLFLWAEYRSSFTIFNPDMSIMGDLLTDLIGYSFVNDYLVFVLFIVATYLSYKTLNKFVKFN